MSLLNNTTNGQVYWEVLNRERRGDYLGQTVQVIPHITEEIKRRIKMVNPRRKYDLVISEVGGTVGDIEGQPFLEAIRQLCLEVGRQNYLIMHLTLVPYIPKSKELKTKPTQHSVQRLREIGLQPDIVVCRTMEDNHLTSEVRSKIALFSSVLPEHVFESPDVESIYEIPLVLQEQGLDREIAWQLGLKVTDESSSFVQEFITRFKQPSHEVTIAMCGKYNALPDAYKSILEAFIHAGVENDARVNVKWVDTEWLERRSDPSGAFKGVDGILIPGGFGERGIEGKIISSGIARENKIPFLGICLGLQCAVIDFARRVCGLEGADSTEFNPKTPHPVVDLLEDQKDVAEMGGTMRLGAYPCVIQTGTRTFAAYRRRKFTERHRHRYEVNNDYRKQLEDHGMILSGVNPDLDLVEIIELPDHPWFVAGQFHPELKSRLVRAHPLFREFIKAAVEYNRD
jgi:CTP synthase